MAMHPLDGSGGTLLLQHCGVLSLKMSRTLLLGEQRLRHSLVLVIWNISLVSVVLHLLCHFWILLQGLRCWLLGLCLRQLNRCWLRRGFLLWLWLESVLFKLFFLIWVGWSLWNNALLKLTLLNWIIYLSFHIWISLLNSNDLILFQFFKITNLWLL